MAKILYIFGTVGSLAIPSPAADSKCAPNGRTADRGRTAQKLVTHMVFAVAPSLIVALLEGVTRHGADDHAVQSATGGERGIPMAATAPRRHHISTMLQPREIGYDACQIAA